MANRPLRLAIVGASVRAAAFSAIRGGFEVVAADMFADADLRRAVSDATRIDDYPEGLALWLKDAACGAWMYTGALENHRYLVGVMSKTRPLLGTSAEAIEVLRHPLTLKNVPRIAGLSVPQIRLTPPPLSAANSWLCKTYRGASGSGVWRLDGAEAAERARREGAVFQRYVEGESASAIFVVSADAAALLGVTRQLLRGGEHPWQYVGSIGPLACSTGIEEQLARLGESLRELGARGVVGVDLVLADDRAWIIEINPRYTASVEILERATGASVVAAHVAACEPALASCLPSAAFVGAAPIHAKRILFASRDVQVSQAFHEWAMDCSSLDPRGCQLADIPRAGEQVPAGRPALTAFGAGGSESEAMGDLERRVGEIERRLYDGG